jgi:hypothetical protein
MAGIPETLGQLESRTKVHVDFRRDVKWHLHTGTWESLRKPLSYNGYYLDIQVPTHLSVVQGEVSLYIAVGNY